MSKDEQELPSASSDPVSPAHALHDEHDGDHDDHDHEGAPLADLPATPVHGYWKSLRELEGRAAFQIERTGHEFPPGAEQAGKDPLSRRNFFHLMGASMRSEEHTSELQS